MSARDRLRTFRYTTASGATFVLQFDELTRSGGRNTVVSEYVGENSGGVQDLGEEIRRYPITCYISGPDYDEEADRFAAALDEAGPGVLDHPRWGILDVLPVSWRQSEHFLNGAGRAVFSVEFVGADAAKFEYLVSRIAADEVIAAGAATLAESMADSLAAAEIVDPSALTALRESVSGGLQAAREELSAITGLTEEVRGNIESAVVAMNRDIEELIRSPIALAQSFLNLYRIPATTVTNVREKIAGYRAVFSQLADTLTSATAGTAAIVRRNTATEVERRRMNADEIASAETVGLLSVAQIYALQAALSEASVAGLSGGTDGGRPIRTRAEAVAAVDEVRSLGNEMNALAEGMGVPTFDVSRDGAAVLATAVGALVDGALALPTERTVLLEGDTTPIHLAVELFGSLDRLDECIEYNELAGDELLLVPRGREVRYYV
ncbi:MAG: DNA circularization N-terminal domain-containing protein [Spirochaetales bacterium]|nr:DNA circularization N-terminal domain-containing protein [Spirochaetales bacterium]